jgi:hypothetical protein
MQDQCATAARRTTVRFHPDQVLCGALFVLNRRRQGTISLMDPMISLDHDCQLSYCTKGNIEVGWIYDFR